MIKILTIALGLSVSASLAQGTTITYRIGDIDGFGGAPGFDNRSAEEQASLNGAQYTDYMTSPTGFLPNDFPLSIRFAIDPFLSISAMTLTIFAYGIQGNDGDVDTLRLTDDAVGFEGELLANFFEGVEMGAVGSAAVTRDIRSELFGRALDGVAAFEILLNSYQGTQFPSGEPAAFDYFELTVTGSFDVPPPPDPVDPTNPAPVPLPAGGLLLPAALLALRVWYRKRV